MAGATKQARRRISTSKKQVISKPVRHKKYAKGMTLKDAPSTYSTGGNVLPSGESHRPKAKKPEFEIAEEDLKRQDEWSKAAAKLMLE